MHIYVYLCVSTCLCMYDMHVVPSEARRGRGIPLVLELQWL